MTNKQWQDFFDMLYEIVEDDRPWKTKLAEVRKQAKERGMQETLEDFAAWFEEG